MTSTVRFKTSVFWALLTVTSALAVVPSVLLVESLTRYLGFLSGWNPGTLRQTSTRLLPHRGGDGQPESTLHFVEFSLNAPRAKSAAVAGDFSHWEPVAMSRVAAGSARWEIQLPLPAGKHQYLFQIDGDWRLDPASKETGRHGDRSTSIKEVKP